MTIGGLTRMDKTCFNSSRSTMKSGFWLRPTFFFFFSSFLFLFWVSFGLVKLSVGNEQQQQPKSTCFHGYERYMFTLTLSSPPNYASEKNMMTTLLNTFCPASWYRVEKKKDLGCLVKSVAIVGNRACDQNNYIHFT